MAEPRWTPEFYEVNGIQLTKTQPEDPAMALLLAPDIHSEMKEGVLWKSDCYICLDPEFAQMGLPLCYPCPACEANPHVNYKGHVAADDTECSECGADAQEIAYLIAEAECSMNGHQWKTYPAYEAFDTWTIGVGTSKVLVPESTSCTHCFEAKKS